MNKLFTTFFIACCILFSNLLWAGEVSRGQFTTAVQDREPVDNIVALSSDQTQISYFTELTDLTGHNVTHQWLYYDDIMFEKTFSVGGARWRVWSTKALQPGWEGRWTVNTLDDDRTLLSTQVFDYQ